MKIRIAKKYGFLQKSPERRPTNMDFRANKKNKEEKEKETDSFTDEFQQKADKARKTTKKVKFLVRESSYRERAALLDFDDEPKKSTTKSKKDSDADQLRDIQSKLDEFEKRQPQISKRTYDRGMDDAEIDSSIHHRQNPRRDADLKQLRDIQSKLDEFEKKPLFGDEAKRKRDELAQYLNIGLFNPSSRQLETQDEPAEPAKPREKIGLVSNIEEVYIKAIRENNESLIRNLVERGHNVSNKVIDEAVFRDRLSIIKFFLKKGALKPIDRLRIFKIFKILSTHRDFKGIDYFIEKNFIDLNGALEQASISGHLSTVEYLIEKGANDLNGALREASCYGRLSVVDKLIEKGANDLNRALRGASYYGRLDAVNKLIEKGADDLSGALEQASISGHLSTVEYLIEKGANDLNRALRLAERPSLVEYLKNKITEKGEK